MDNLLVSLLVGILGGEAARYAETNNHKMNIPIRLIYLISFAIFYNICMIFMGIVYLLKGFLIPWGGIAIFSTLISLAISTILFILKKIKK